MKGSKRYEEKQKNIKTNFGNFNSNDYATKCYYRGKY